MSIAADLLRADRIGIRDLKEHISTKSLNALLIITDRGTPVSVNMPYSDLLELVDILDELSDPGVLKTIQEGRKATEAGAKGISAARLFNRIRAKRK